MLRRWAWSSITDVANEIASRLEAGAHGICQREHAVEGEGHVVVFEEFGDGEHAAEIQGCRLGSRLSACGSGRALLGWTADGGCP